MLINCDMNDNEKLTFILEMYESKTVREILDELNKKYPKELNLSVLKTFFWAPRFINNHDFNSEYNNLLSQNQYTLGNIQYNYGLFLQLNIKKIFDLNPNHNFNTLFELFKKLRIRWNQQIGKGYDTFKYRYSSSNTCVIGRYKGCEIYLNKLYNDFKDVNCDENNIIKYTKENIHNEFDDNKFKEIFTITFNGISHSCVYSEDAWVWNSDDNVTDKMCILSNLYENESFPSFYYSMIALCPLYRGTASIGEMFRYYECLKKDINFCPVKKEYIALDTYALSTHPNKFISEWDNLFDNY